MEQKIKIAQNFLMLLTLTNALKQKTIGVKLNQNSGWIPQSDFPQDSTIQWYGDKKLKESHMSPEKNYDENKKINQQGNPDKFIFNISNLNKNYGKFTEIMSKIKPVSLGNIQFISPRNLDKAIEPMEKTEKLPEQNSELDQNFLSDNFNENNNHQKRNLQKIEQLQRMKENLTRTEWNNNTDKMEEQKLNQNGFHKSRRTATRKNDKLMMHDVIIVTPSHETTTSGNHIFTGYEYTPASEAKLSSYNDREYFSTTEPLGIKIDNITSVDSKNQEQFKKKSKDENIERREDTQTNELHREKAAMKNNKNPQNLEPFKLLNASKKIDLQPKITNSYTNIRTEGTTIRNSTDEETTKLNRLPKQTPNYDAFLGFVKSNGIKAQLGSSLNQTARGYYYGNDYSSFKPIITYPGSPQIPDYNYTPREEPIKLTNPPFYDPYDYTPQQQNFITDVEIIRQDKLPSNQPYNSIPQNYQTGTLPANNIPFYNAPGQSYYNVPSNYQSYGAPPYNLVPEQNYQSYGVPPQNYQTTDPNYVNYQTFATPSQVFQIPAAPSPTYPTSGMLSTGQSGVSGSLPIYTSPQTYKPYSLKSFIKMVLTDEQCVMSREVTSDALVEIDINLNIQVNQFRHCALSFTSVYNIAVSTMIQTDESVSTTELARQLNIRMFIVRPTGHIAEVQSPWFYDNSSPGITLGESNTVIITLQPTTSIIFKMLIFSYKDTAYNTPLIFNFLLTANATMPLNETDASDKNTNTSSRFFLALQ